MNDFTKEELEIISLCVENDFYNSNYPRSMYEPLYEKIQSMIDNYCDHEYLLTITINGESCSLICSKCNKVYINE